jgi:hypothetical protein
LCNFRNHSLFFATNRNSSSCICFVLAL